MLAEDQGNFRVVDHVGEAVGAKKQAIALKERDVMGFHLDILLVSSQTIDQHVAIKFGAEPRGNDAGVHELLGLGVIAPVNWADLPPASDKANRRHGR